MTGKVDNVGFLTTGSGVKQFQLSLWGYFVPRCLFFTATPARPASLSRSRFPETCEVPGGIMGRNERDGSWTAGTCDKRHHAQPPSRQGFADSLEDRI